MPLHRIKKHKGVYGLYRGKAKKVVRDAEITAYYINYRDETGKPIKERTEAATAAEAELLLKQRIIKRDRNKEDEIIDKKSKVRGKINIGQIANEYFDTLEDKTANRSKNHFNRDLSTVAKLKRVREMDVKKLKKMLQKRELAPKTINNATDLLRTIIRFGVKNDFLDKDSYKLESYTKLPVDNISTVYLEPDEVRELFKRSLLPDRVLKGEVAQPEENYIPTYTKTRTNMILKTLYFTAQRPKSVLQLRKKDISHDTKDGWKIHIAPIKSQPAHDVPIAKDLLDDLLKWTEKLEPDHYIFHPHNKPLEQLSHFTVIEQCKPLFKSMNAGKSFKDDRKTWISLYVLRHSAATNIMATTGSLALAGKLLNHQDSRTTKRYAKVVDALVKGAVDDL